MKSIKCDNIFEQNIDKHLYAKQGCPKCANNIKLTLSDIIKKSNIIHNNKYFIDNEQIYINNRSKIKIKCKKCDNIFEQIVSNHLSGEGCNCENKSKGETIIEKYLLKNKIIYETQKRFLKCKNIKTLPFDFFIPSLKLLIEFDGRQHFNINTKYYTNDIKNNDNIKTDFCKNNCYNLLRIRFDENIIEKLNEKIC